MFFKKIKSLWKKVINIGVVPEMIFSERKKVHIINGLAIVGGMGTTIYMIAMFVLKPSQTNIVEIDPFYYLNFILIGTFAGLCCLNYLKLHNTARAIGLIIAVLFYTYVGWYSGKPYEGELFILLIAIGVFVIFNQIRFIIPLFLFAFICFFILIINVATKNPATLGYIIGSGVYIRIITLFTTLFFLLNLFRTEHIGYQKEIEEKNKKLQDQQNELLSQSEMLEEQTLELMRLNEAKDKLFSIIGHDLRTPIGGLKSFMDFINEDELSPEEFVNFSKELKVNIDNVYIMLETLLEWSQSQIRGIINNPTYINIKELVEEKVKLFADVAKSKQLSLSHEIVKDIFVFADMNYIRLILRNLLSNAIKFTPNGGIISIKSEENADFIILIVQDTGIGMTQEQIDNSFKKDLKHSQKGTQGERGAGLGLWLVKEFIEASKAEIWIESKLGSGSKFCIKLKK
jgi:signal transduction histidine kinase